MRVRRRSLLLTLAAFLLAAARQAGAVPTPPSAAPPLPSLRAPPQDVVARRGRWAVRQDTGAPASASSEPSSSSATSRSRPSETVPSSSRSSASTSSASSSSSPSSSLSPGSSVSSSGTPAPTFNAHSTLHRASSSLSNPAFTGIIVVSVLIGGALLTFLAFWFLRHRRPQRPTRTSALSMADRRECLGMAADAPRTQTRRRSVSGFSVNATQPLRNQASFASSQQPLKQQASLASMAPTGSEFDHAPGYASYAPSVDRGHGRGSSAGSAAAHPLQPQGERALAHPYGHAGAPSQGSVAAGSVAHPYAVAAARDDDEPRRDRVQDWRESVVARAGLGAGTTSAGEAGVAR